MSEKESIFLRLFNEKVVTFIAIFIAFVYLLPSKQGFDFRDIRWAAIWLIGGIFTWKKKTWAAVLLALIAVYELVFHIIPDIRTFGQFAGSLKNDFSHLSESTIYRVGCFVYSIAVLTQLYVICYSIKKVILSSKSRNLISR
jgi:hypothetical protein